MTEFIKHKFNGFYIPHGGSYIFLYVSVYTGKKQSFEIEGPPP